MENEYMQRHMDWKKLWLLYRKKVWQILLFTVASALLGAGIYRVIKAVTYEGQFYRVSSDYYITFNFDEYENSVDYYNAYTWDNILRDDPIVDEALAILPDDYTKEEIKASVTGEMLGDYRILTVYATHEDPIRAEEIAYAYTESLSLFADKIEMLDTIELWSREECLPVVEKDLTVNAALLGAVLGLIVALVSLAIRYILDDSIYSERDFTERFSIPFLGTLTKKKSELCKQELKDNLSYLLKEDGGYYLVPVVADNNGTVPDTSLKEMQELHGSIRKSLTLSGTDLDELRKSNGVLLMIPWGGKNGKLTEKTIAFLQKQDCKIAGVVLYNADDKFLQKYYKG